MIDRIEELLAELAAEDEEEQEDILAQKRGAVVSSGPRSERNERGKAPEGRTAFAQAESSDRAANRRSVTTGETDAESAPAAGELWKDGPVWTVRGGSPEIDEAQRMATAEQAAQTEEILLPVRDGDFVLAGSEGAAQGSVLGLALERLGRSGAGQAGLEGLYCQTVRGLRPAAPALPPEQAGRTAREREPGSAASLAVDELDRAVRRDSRRYDGGMSIY